MKNKLIKISQVGLLTAAGILLFSMVGCQTAKTANSRVGNATRDSAPMKSTADAEGELDQFKADRVRKTLEMNQAGQLDDDQTLAIVKMLVDENASIEGIASDDTVAGYSTSETAVPATFVQSTASPYDPYRPTLRLKGLFRSIGSDTMDNMMSMWESAFKNHHPQLAFRHEGKGSSTATPALVEGRADFGPMSRPLKEVEVQKFVQKFGKPPVQIPVARDALAIYVHPENPILEIGITMAQIDAIFSNTHKLGHPGDIRTWGDLGLQGEWSTRPITVYSRNKASGTYGFFKDIVLKKGAYKTTNIELSGSAEVVEAIEQDKFAIGYSGIGYITDGVRAVPVAEGVSSTPVPATESNVASSVYPLSRSLYLTLVTDGNSPKDEMKREFIRFVYSDAGQQIVQSDGYFSISPIIANESLKLF